MANPLPSLLPWPTRLPLPGRVAHLSQVYRLYRLYQGVPEGVPRKMVQGRELWLGQARP